MMKTYMVPIGEGGVAIEGWQERGQAPAARRSGSAARRDAFVDLVRSHDRNLRVLTFRLLGDRDQMDDALQEAYLRAYKALPSFREEAAAATWLYRIVYNVCVDRLRARRRTEKYMGPVGSLEDLSGRGLEPRAADDPAAAAEHKGDLDAALAGLSPDHRATVLLVDAVGYDYGTAANILGVREGTIASRLHTARALLRGALFDRNEEGHR
ncbi:MAG: RNA polymerase sigma factor [Thermoleophilia bacterium]